MLRGRHRGLPSAIDRAIILPFEFKEAEPSFDAQLESRPAADDRRSSRRSTAGLSSHPNGREPYCVEDESGGEKLNSDEIKSCDSPLVNTGP